MTTLEEYQKQRVEAARSALYQHHATNDPYCPVADMLKAADAVPLPNEGEIVEVMERAYNAAITEYVESEFHQPEDYQQAKLRAMRACLTTLRPALAAMAGKGVAEGCALGGWQPRETAPKDGTAVLVVGDVIYATSGSYHKQKLSRPAIAINNFSEEWCDEDKWCLVDDSYSSEVFPTHWMHLPPKPTVEEKK